MGTACKALPGSGPSWLQPRPDTLRPSLINATGRWSNLRRPSKGDQVSLREKWLGLKGHFAEAPPPASVDLYFFEGGYCGVSAVRLAGEDHRGGRVNVCAMVRPSVASTLSEVFLQNRALRERSRHWQPLSEPVSTSPLIFGAPRPTDGNVFCVGDAAGFVDPFVGDGISLALRSGALAAEALIPFFRRELTLAAAAADYRRSYQQQLAPIFRNSSRIRQALVLPRMVRKPALFVLQSVPTLTRRLVSMTR